MTVPYTVINEILKSTPDRTDRWLRLYRTSVTFRHQMDTMASLIPMWVEGMAQEAEKHDAEYRVALQSVFEGTNFSKQIEGFFE